MAMEGMGNVGGMSGFGSAPVAEGGVAEKILSGLDRLSDKLSGSPSPTHLCGERGGQTVSHLYKPMSEVHTLTEAVTNRGPYATTTATHTHHHESHRKHTPGRAGGGWDDEPSYHGNTSTSCSSGNDSITPGVEQESDWSAEHKLVTDTLGTCGDGWLTRNQANTFLNRCSDCNCDVIMDVINSQLTNTTPSAPSQTHTMRALQLVEHITHSDLVHIDRVVDICCSNLQHVYQCTTGPCRSKAKKILLILERLSSQSHLLPTTSPSHTPSIEDIHLSTQLHDVTEDTQGTQYTS